MTQGKNLADLTQTIAAISSSTWNTVAAYAANATLQ
jgi:hypothetical protein